MLRFARGLYFAALAGAGRLLTRKPAWLYGAGEALGWLRYHVGYIGPKRSRRVYLTYMKRALPALPSADVENALLRFWVNHEKNTLELFLLPRLTPQNVGDYVDFQGLEHLSAALAAGRGAVIAPPHFGNERLLHVALALKGYPLTVMTSAFEDAPENLRRARLDPARRVHELVFPSDNVKRVYDALKRNRIVQFSPTAAGGTSGTWCECFGARLYVNTAPARLALHQRAPLLPAFIYRSRDNRHRVVVEAPLTGAAVKEDAAALTRDLMRRVEERVVADPDQFYWMWLVIRSQEAEAKGRKTA